MQVSQEQLSQMSASGQVMNTNQTTQNDHSIYGDSSNRCHLIKTIILKISTSVHYHPLEILSQCAYECGHTQMQPKNMFLINTKVLLKFLYRLNLQQEYPQFIGALENKPFLGEVNNPNDTIDNYNQFVDQFNYQRAGMYNALEISNDITSITARESPAGGNCELVKYALLFIIHNEKQYRENSYPDVMLFNRYCTSTISIPGKLDAKVWTIHSLQQINDKYGLGLKPGNYSQKKQSQVEEVWLFLRNQDSPQGQEYLSFDRLQTILETHRNVEDVKNCFCYENDHNWKTSKKNQCLKAIKDRTNLRLKVPLREKLKHFQQFQFDINSHINKIIGEGYPLYFDFIKYCGLILLMLFLTSGAYDLFSNSSLGDDCSSTPSQANGCQLNWITQWSIENKRYSFELNHIQNVMAVFSIVSIVVVFQFLRRSKRMIVKNLDMQQVQFSDYSIVIKKIEIPKQKRAQVQQQLGQRLTKELEEKEIQKFLAERIQKYIEKVVLKRFQILGKEKENKLANQKIFIVQKSENRYWAFVTLEYEQQQLLFLQQELKWYNLAYYFQSSQIVILDQNKSGENKRIVYKIKKCKKLFIGVPEDEQEQDDFSDLKKFEVYLPEEPQEYIWVNIKHRRKLLRFLTSTVVWLSLLVASLALISVVNDYQSKWYNQIMEYKNQQEQQAVAEFLQSYRKVSHAHNFTQLRGKNSALKHGNIQQEGEKTTSEQVENQQQLQQILNQQKTYTMELLLISQMVAWTIQALNYFLIIVAQKLNNFLRNDYVTTNRATFARKIIALRFVTSVFALFFLNVIMVWYQEGLTQARKNIYKHGGLIYNIFWVFVNNSIKDPVVYLFSFMIPIVQNNLMGKIGFCLKCALKKCVKSVKHDMNHSSEEQLQEQENFYLMYSPEYSIEDRYAWVINTIFLTIFYAPILPVGFLISLAGLIFMYRIEKFFILNLVQIKQTLNVQLASIIVEILELVLPLYIVSNFFFEYIIVHGVYTDPNTQQQFRFGGSPDIHGFQNIIIDLYQQADVVFFVTVAFGIWHMIENMEAFNENYFPIMQNSSQEEVDVPFRAVQIGLLDTITYAKCYANHMSRQMRLQEKYNNGQEKEFSHDEEIREFDRLNALSYDSKHQLKQHKNIMNKKGQKEGQNYHFFSVDKILLRIFNFLYPSDFSLIDYEEERQLIEEQEQEEDAMNHNNYINCDIMIKDLPIGQTSYLQ